MERCVLSFFDDSYQREVKERCFGKSKFEDTLEAYRNLFLSEFRNLGIIKTRCTLCKDCFMQIKAQDEYIAFLNDLLTDISQKNDYIELLFNEVRDIYITTVTQNRSVAMDKMNTYLSNRCHNYLVDSAIGFSRPFFRARQVGSYDGSDIHELFHVPFDKRYLIGNQRFSLTGIPLLYIAESLPLALREIECDIRKANAAVFIPKYSNYFRDGMYVISNPIFTNLITLEKDMIAGCRITYDHNLNISFSKKDIDEYLARFVMTQCIQYPVQKEYSGAFTQEYVLPQLLMDVVNTKKWAGIQYQSCKKIPGEKRDEFQQFIDKNICFNVPYKSSRYNEEMLEDFYYATWSNGEKTNTYSELVKKISELKALIDIALKNGFNMNDYIMYLSRMEMHIDKMMGAIGRRSYQRRKDCQVEITLFYKLLEKITPIYEKPEEFGIVKLK